MDQAVPKGGTATFSVAATSGTALSYQWYFGSTAISGAKASTLLCPKVSYANAGLYSVAVRNGGGTVNSRQAMLTVTNILPLAKDDVYTTPENVSLVVPAPGTLTNDVDANGDMLAAVLVTDVSHGSLNLNANGGFSYTPATNYSGTDSFSYQPSDGLALGNVAVVTLNIPAVNYPPIAVNDSASTFANFNVTVPVLANDSEPEGAPLRILSTSTTNGMAVISGTNVVFTPAADFSGTVVFSYVITDGTNSATAGVTVTVIDTSFHFIQSWTTGYNGSANTADYLQASAVDAQGNLYVTGYAKESASGNYDFVTFKFDPNGKLCWRAVYDGPAGDDQANALALDSAGNVYVTGASKGPGSTWDYATVKYDSQGNQLWAARYNGTANKDDIARAVAVDARGSVFITGASKGAADHFNYVTIKYDSAGNQLWLARYVGPGNAEDDATALALDSAGNVYVTGQSKGSGSDFDYATIKYGGDGAQLWLARYNGPGNKADQAARIAVDGAGNVYVAGSSLSASGDADYATLKYGTSGTQLWVARYNGPANKDDFAAGLAVDSAGNVFVTGASALTDTRADYATVKYSPLGARLWAQRYDLGEDDQATALALDSLGDVYVTGKSKAAATGYDFATIKYLSRDGTQAGSVRFNSSGNLNDCAVALAVDSQFNVYVAGQGFNPLDYVMVKYQPSYFAPTASTLAASNIAPQSAVLNGVVNPQGGATTCFFRYGVTTNYGSLSTAATLAPATNSVAVAAPIAGLACGMVYHCSIVASNAAGIFYGQDASFATLSLPPIHLGAALVSQGTGPRETMQLSLASASGLGFRVLASTNMALPLTDWTVVGAMAESLPGQYQFTDPQPATNPSCYYRIVLP